MSRVAGVAVSAMEDRRALTQQSIVDFLSTALEPQDDGNYLKDLYQVLQSAYANDEDQDRFKAKVEICRATFRPWEPQPHPRRYC